MRSSSIFILFGLVLGGVACSASPADEAQSSEAAYTQAWQKVLTCDGGAAVLDVDARERRNLQFVVRDRNITSYLRGQMRGLPEDQSWAKDPRFASSIKPFLNASGELVVPSRDIVNGVFSPSDFGRDDIFYSETYRLGNAWIVVRREGAGVKLVLADSVKADCEGGTWGYQGGCWGGRAVRVREMHEIANWYFQDCR